MTAPFTRTKIVATVGPASNTREKLLELITAGVNVFRLNFSHGSHEQHQLVIDYIKSLRKEFGFTVAMLQDLSGPKMRIGEVENGAVELKEGEELVFTTEKVIVGNANLVSCTYQSLSKDVKHGDAILLDDGNLEVRVTKIEPNKVYTKVIVGGILKSKKGVNLPDSEISEASLTKKDKEDLVFGLKNEVDWVAISFVRKASDVAELKDLIKQHNSQARVIAKIERPEAIKNIDEIIEVTDGLMVARGDLGVEIDLADVPMEQKKIIIKCNQAAKPVIVATQMMESMITNARPTRAEAGDVANAVIDGADAVMLSAETASGKYPVLTVQYMKEIIKAAEKHPNIYHKFYAGSATDKDFNSNIIIDNACRIARAGECKAIVGMTYSGFAAFRISRHRPTADIHIFTANKQLLYILNLVWGIRTYYYGKIETTDTTISAFENILINAGHLRKGETFVSTGTIPIQSRLRTNMVKFNIVS